MTRRQSRRVISKERRRWDRKLVIRPEGFRFMIISFNTIQQKCPAGNRVWTGSRFLYGRRLKLEASTNPVREQNQTTVGNPNMDHEHGLLVGCNACYALLCFAWQCFAVLCFGYDLLCLSMLCHVPCFAILCLPSLCSAMVGFAALCHAFLC